MYLEYTVQDTLRDLRSLLIDAIPGFEFPRKVLSYSLDYHILDNPNDGELYWNEIPMSHLIYTQSNFDEMWHPIEEETDPEELYWSEIPANKARNKSSNSDLSGTTIFDGSWNHIANVSQDDMIQSGYVPVAVDMSYFHADLTDEEINILALLMMRSWLQRQVTSIENIRMKYSGSDFKFTSQANHLAKLMALQTECRRQSHHMQRLYKRRKVDENGQIHSNWSVLREKSALN